MGAMRVMKLWEVTNGYVGSSYDRCLVVARTAAEAIETARPAFKAATKPTWDGGKPLYPARYYEDLEAKLLCDDLTKPWCGTVDDG